VVICLVRGADLHTAQLMPLPLTVSCFSKIQIGFTFLVPAHPGSPGQRAVKRMCVCVFIYPGCTTDGRTDGRSCSPRPVPGNSRSIGSAGVAAAGACDVRRIIRSRSGNPSTRARPPGRHAVADGSVRELCVFTPVDRAHGAGRPGIRRRWINGTA